MRSNWSGNYRYTAERLHEPADLAELQEIVAGATSLRALGSTHSFNSIADDGVAQVSLDKFAADIQIDGETRTVSFAANTRYGDLARVLEPAGWALHNLASLPHISVAGAIATATHGSGLALGNLATAVVALQIVRADGTVVEVDKSHPDFLALVVGLGGFGVVSRITLAIEPSFAIAQTVFLDLGWAEAQNQFDQIMGCAYSVSMFTDWSESGVQQVWVKSRTGAAPMLDSTALDSTVPALEASHPILGAPAHFATQQLAIPGPWNERLPHFRFEFTPSSGEEIQTEYLLPRSLAAEAIDALRGIAHVFRPILLVSEIRCVAGDELLLSTAFGRDSVAFHFTWVRDQRAVESAVRVIENALRPFDSRPHWGKVFESAPQYPRHAEFADAVTRWDAEGVFRNQFLTRVLHAE